MIQRLLFFIAGVDRRTMLDCPATDRMWASHIGFSLCLSFTVVLGISYLATGYMLESIPSRCVIALIIATTVFMFDRALFQSDWFVQGAFHIEEPTEQRIGDNLRRHAGRFLRVAMRLTMSLGLAWVIALFLELALFSDTISDKIERDRIASNRPAFEQIAQYEAELDRQIATRAANLGALEKSLLDSLAEAPQKAPSTRGDELDRRLKLLGERETALFGEVHQIELSIQQHLTDMNAEELGQKLKPLNTGRTGQGPRYEFAKREKESLEALLQSRRDELAQIAQQRDAIQRAQIEQTAAAAAVESENRTALDERRVAIRAQVEAASAEFRKAEADKRLQVEEFRRNILERSHIRAKRDAADPLTRIAAYEDLKSDPKDGRVMTLFSWMTRCLIIFLEIVPVVAKIFFSPPSIYALKVQAEIDRARRSVRQMMTQPLEPAQVSLALDTRFDRTDPGRHESEHRRQQPAHAGPADVRLRLGALFRNWNWIGRTSSRSRAETRLDASKAVQAMISRKPSDGAPYPPAPDAHLASTAFTPGDAANAALAPDAPPLDVVDEADAVALDVRQREATRPATDLVAGLSNEAAAEIESR